MSSSAIANRPKLPKLNCRLQQWLKESGLNYTQLANEIRDKTGGEVSVGAIRRLAKNQVDRIDISNALEICHFFGKSFSEMFYEEK